MQTAKRIEMASRRSKIVMTSRGDSGLREFRELISQYSAVAHALNARKRKLAEEIKAERDVEKLKNLVLRKSTVEAERYEVLADMRAMISYVKEREKCLVKE